MGWMDRLLQKANTMSAVTGRRLNRGVVEDAVTAGLKYQYGESMDLAKTRASINAAKEQQDKQLAQSERLFNASQALQRETNASNVSLKQQELANTASYNAANIAAQNRRLQLQEDAIRANQEDAQAARDQQSLTSLIKGAVQYGPKIYNEATNFFSGKGTLADEAANPLSEYNVNPYTDATSMEYYGSYGQGTTQDAVSEYNPNYFSQEQIDRYNELKTNVENLATQRQEAQALENTYENYGNNYSGWETSTMGTTASPSYSYWSEYGSGIANLAMSAETYGQELVALSAGSYWSGYEGIADLTNVGTGMEGLSGLSSVGGVLGVAGIGLNVASGNYVQAAASAAIMAASMVCPIVGIVAGIVYAVASNWDSIQGAVEDFDNFAQEEWGMSWEHEWERAVDPIGDLESYMGSIDDAVGGFIDDIGDWF